MAGERLNPMQGTGVWPWNENLLDNWDFRRLINQRGLSGKITTAGYFIDRWKLTSGSVEITSGGLILNGTMVQSLEYGPDGTTTATVLTADGPKAAQYSAETKTFTVTGNGETLIAAKLEEGPVQTLAHKENGVWVLNRRAVSWQEMYKCRQYQQKAQWHDGAYGGAIGFGFANGTNMFRMSIPLSVPLRGTPTIEYLHPADQPAPTLVIFAAGQMYNVKSIYEIVPMGSMVYLQITIDGTVTPNTPGVLKQSGVGNILFNCNL